MSDSISLEWTTEVDHSMTITREALIAALIDNGARIEPTATIKDLFDLWHNTSDIEGWLATREGSGDPTIGDGEVHSSTVSRELRLSVADDFAVTI